MKGIILALTVLASGSAFAAHPAAIAVKNAFRKGQAILAMKSADQRNTQMCALIKSAMDTAAIGPQLLGSYYQSSDRKGVQSFMREMPSLATTKLISMGGDGSGAQIDVDDNAYDRGGGLLEVSISAHTSNGNAYNAKAIVVKSGSSYKLRDAEYLGFSLVHYLGNDIQKKIAEKESVNPRQPVSAFMQEQLNDPKYIHCN